MSDVTLLGKRQQRIYRQIALLQRITEGDREAFDEFHHDTLLDAIQVASAVLIDASHIEDVVQETYLRLWRSAKSYQSSEGTPFAWFLTIVRNCALNVVMDTENKNLSSGGGNIRMSQLHGLESVAAPLEIVVSDYAAMAADIHCIDALIDELPFRFRDLMGLIYREDMTVSEIAAYLKLPLGTVKTRHRRALEIIRVLLMI
ncbi:MAG: RNA polymerase sigma factor [Polaromonas sp.]|nr:RNA polymerase sigma factor [Polaromonas sp.]